MTLTQGAVPPRATHSGASIMAADHGGYIVLSRDDGHGYEKRPLYAGELSACLEFLRLFMTPPEQP